MQETRHQFHEDLRGLEVQALDGLDLVTLQLDRSLESISYQDVELAGIVIPAGMSVVAGTAAANRDPSVFPDPDRFDITRQAAESMLTFGGGIHYCLGAPLARLEAQLAFPALLTRYPNLQLFDGAQRRDSLTLRGYLHLPVNC